MKHDVSNEQFNAAYSDKDTRGVVNKALSGFAGKIPPDELDACGALAIWNAMRSFNPEKKVKFHSWAFNHAIWTCLDHLSENSSVNYDNLDTVVEAVSSGYPQFAELLDGLSPKDSEILIKKFFDNYRTIEIAEQNSITKRMVRKRLAKALERFERICI